MDRKTRQRYESLAHLLECVLGKDPDRFGLVLDPEGWAENKQLLQALSEEEGWRGIHANRILDLNWALADSPFEIEETRIRLRPDHPGALESPRREPGPPPAILFYGSRRKPYPNYLEKGIRLADNREIVLAREKTMALRIASRRDPKPILVEVSTRTAEEKGVRFSAYGKSLFLADWLPSDSLSGPPMKEDLRARPKPKKAASPSEAAQGAPPRTLPPRPWNPKEDTLLSRDPEESRKRFREERGRKKVGWKEQTRRDKRKRSGAD